jgi:hypothetical protein
LRIDFIRLIRNVLPEFSTTTGKRTFHLGLKVLSSEMDPAEIRFIRKAFVKEKGADVFRKNPPVPHPVRAL